MIALIELRKELYMGFMLLAMEQKGNHLPAFTCLYEIRTFIFIQPTYDTLRGLLTDNFYVLQFNVEAYCFAGGRCLFKQPPECYIPLESVWRGDLKKVQVRLSVRF